MCVSLSVCVCIWESRVFFSIWSSHSPISQYRVELVDLGYCVERPEQPECRANGSLALVFHSEQKFAPWPRCRAHHSVWASWILVKKSKERNCGNIMSICYLFALTLSLDVVLENTFDFGAVSLEPLVVGWNYCYRLTTQKSAWCLIG